MSAANNQELEQEEEEQRKAISIGQARPLFKAKTPEEERAWQEKLAEMLESGRRQYATDIARLYTQVYPNGDPGSHASASQALETILYKLKITKNPDGSFLVPKLNESQDPQIYIYAILLAIKESSAVPMVNAQGKSTPQEAIALLRTTLSRGLFINPKDLPSLIKTIEDHRDNPKADLSDGDIEELNSLIVLSQANTDLQVLQQNAGNLLNPEERRTDLLKEIAALDAAGKIDFNATYAQELIEYYDGEIASATSEELAPMDGEEEEDALAEGDSLMQEAGDEAGARAIDPLMRGDGGLEEAVALEESLDASKPGDKSEDDPKKALADPKPAVNRSVQPRLRTQSDGAIATTKLGKEGAKEESKAASVKPLPRWAVIKSPTVLTTPTPTQTTTSKNTSTGVGFSPGRSFGS